MRGYILDLIKTLSLKTKEQPSLVSFMFTDSRTGVKRGSYLPIQILLLLLIKEDMYEEEGFKIALRECLLMQLNLDDTIV